MHVAAPLVRQTTRARVGQTRRTGDEGALTVVSLLRLGEQHADDDDDENRADGDRQPSDREDSFHQTEIGATAQILRAIAQFA